ncbi:MAG: hypothetical protein N0C90_24270 [Candidatus Thiodiazotropha endolucinida]|nr:hypothetical protein [Candidatus Thiodiazotropha taylori]MCW4264466.1 hypothetical protein [Candidatus Thiodiazotropha endolucinida]
MLMAYNSSRQESIKFSPSVMVFGRDIELPVDLLYPAPPNGNAMPADGFARKLQTHLQNVHELARTSLLEASQKQKRLYDRRISKHQYKNGDAVWLRVYARPKGLSKKLQLRWEGPFKIISQISDLTYKIKRGQKHICKIVHFNRLKPYKGRLSAWFKQGSL